MSTGAEPGGKRLHRKERHCGYKGKGPLVLYRRSAPRISNMDLLNLHLLKLVTGVDISTRAVIKSGRPGNPMKRRSRAAAAAPNKAAFLLSMPILRDVS